MLNKNKPSSGIGTKEKETETERKPLNKAGIKGEGAQCKPESKSQQNKTQAGHKECSGMSEEEDEDEE